MASESDPVNINTTDDLLAGAGRGYKLQQATFRINRQPVLLEYTNSQCHVEKFSTIMQTASRSMMGTWIQIPSGICCEPDTACKVPKIVVSRAFQHKGSDFAKFSPSISFIYIVQGLCDASKAKVVLAWDVETAAAGMIHEALNGYSTVFSAAIHKNAASLVMKRQLSQIWTQLEFKRTSYWSEMINLWTKSELGSSLENTDGVDMSHLVTLVDGKKVIVYLCF